MDMDGQLLERKEVYMSAYIFVLYTEKSDFFHGAVVLAVYVPL